ncbi:mannose-6-phosphate isomerase [Salisediminibacterium halotolerans]|uniref:Mannose-6-phosphate isomerase n=2 Tax=Salisediminibacterium halotolerans TaxID=517425 RepID=A0A1H9VL21_9BACI|nr:mannose-6-phosphate isomerase, class I [Salisediminibacterium haloalkalitolerans]SES22231.1 mannose-6-phosphate isomerase [Salisediminibacterium haloalkalitolerans]
MMNDILKFEPVCKEKVWGGTKLEKIFGYSIPSDRTGECWGISGHQSGTNKVVNGLYHNKTLRDVWFANPELFGRASTAEEEFPLLVKMIDARDDLSVQVHPDDTYAKEQEGYAYGKTECWYILDADPGAELILGHHAATKEELSSWVYNGEWDKLFRRVPVQNGDFIYVPSGTVHAIGAGIVLLEIQQSSDITYRFYDYDRPDQHGELRDLHIEDSIACTNVPHEEPLLKRPVSEHGGLLTERLIAENYFTVKRLTLQEKNASVRIEPDTYELMTVISGGGEITIGERTYELEKGDHFLVPATVSHYFLAGEMTLICSTETAHLSA